MAAVLTILVVVSLLVVAGLAFATALGAPLQGASSVAAWVAEALLVVNAVADVARLVGGGTSSEPVVHLGYVLVSVLLLPILVRPLGDDASDDDIRGRQLVLALACMAILVVVWRQAVTA